MVNNYVILRIIISDYIYMHNQILVCSNVIAMTRLDQYSGGFQKSEEPMLVLNIILSHLNTLLGKAFFFKQKR